MLYIYVLFFYILYGAGKKMLKHILYIWMPPKCNAKFDQNQLKKTNNFGSDVIKL